MTNMMLQMPIPVQNRINSRRSSYRERDPLDLMVNSVPSFADLCKPSLYRIKNLTERLSLEQGENFFFEDGLKVDLIFVHRGLLQITLTMLPSERDKLEKNQRQKQNVDEYKNGFDNEQRVHDYSENDESDELDYAKAAPHEIKILIENGDYIDHIKRASKEYGLYQYEI